MIRIKILKENRGRQLLSEVALKDAIATCDSKKVKKTIFNIIKDYYSSGQASPSELEKLASSGASKEMELTLLASKGIKRLKNLVVDIGMLDIEENQKGAAAIWLKNQLLKKKGIFVKDSLYRIYVSDVHKDMLTDIEMFFQANRFIEEPDSRDINTYNSIEDLRGVVDVAREKYQAHLGKKNYLDAEQGSELIYEDEMWKIYIPRNKGAACELGKGTDWCTAAPGLEYYEDYHSDEDPLFIFINKERPTIKFQFHYGSEQFMDRYDRPVKSDTMLKLHQLLIKSDVVQRDYPKLVDKFTIQKIGKDSAVIEKAESKDVSYDPRSGDHNGNRLTYKEEYKILGNYDELHNSLGPSSIYISRDKKIVEKGKNAPWVNIGWSYSGSDFVRLICANEYYFYMRIPGASLVGRQLEGRSVPIEKYLPQLESIKDRINDQDSMKLPEKEFDLSIPGNDDNMMDNLKKYLSQSEEFQRLNAIILKMFADTR